MKEYQVDCFLTKDAKFFILFFIFKVDKVICIYIMFAIKESRNENSKLNKSLQGTKERTMVYWGKEINWEDVQ